MIGNALFLAMRAIRRNLMRSTLTTLGVVIGVAAVITMVHLGRGATAQVSAQISSLGSNLLMVRPGQRLGPGMRSGAPNFTMNDVRAIEQEINDVSAVAPIASAPTLAIYGNQNWSTTITGTDNEYFIVRNWQIGSGRKFEDGELRAGKAVCVIGPTVARELFGAQDPVGMQMRLKNIACQIVGVLQSKGQTSMGSDQDDTVVVPIRMLWRRIAGNQDINQIQVSAKDGANTTLVKKNIEVLMRERRRISPTEDDNFSVRDLQEIAATLTGTTQVLTTLLGAVAAVSLLVGGIGIMNIMLVSVTERTREIGIRLAVGALERDVLLQFLVEAVVLSTLGGVIGILLAVGASVGLTHLMKVPFVFSPGIVIIAFFFSAAVGIVFGYFPARKAARLDPIDALRHE